MFADASQAFSIAHCTNSEDLPTRSQGISQFYLHTPRSSAIGMNHTCLCLSSRSWYSFTDPGGMEGWVGLWVAGWLHTEIIVRHFELNPDTVAHLSTSRTRHRLTSLIEADTLTTMPDHQTRWSGIVDQQYDQVSCWDSVSVAVFAFSHSHFLLFNTLI